MARHILSRELQEPLLSVKKLETARHPQHLPPIWARLLVALQRLPKMQRYVVSFPMYAPSCLR